MSHLNDLRTEKAVNIYFFEDTEVYIKGYNIYRKDRNRYGGGGAVYAQHSIPLKICKDMIKDEIEALWLQVHIPHRKPILLGSCYRPPNDNNLYLNKICEISKSKYYCGSGYLLHG